MNITKSQHTIELTSSECSEIAYDIYYALRHTVETHWINHPDVWLENEKGRIKRMELFFKLANCEFVNESLMNELSGIIEKNKKQPN